VNDYLNGRLETGGNVCTMKYQNIFKVRHLSSGRFMSAETTSTLPGRAAAG